MDPAADLAAALAAATAACQADFANAGTTDAVETARIAWLGRTGRLKDLQDAFRAAPNEQKRTLGPAFNAAKGAMEDAWKAAAARLAAAAGEAPIDVTLPPRCRRTGSIHPLSHLADDVERVFESMGYTVIDGPHLELDEHNFGNLNIPADHPARDAQDTFWLDCPAWGGAKKLLRTHTSAMQSRVYAAVGRGELELPLRRVVVGKVFRYEAVDATHDNTFTQVEGFVIDREITVAHLVGSIRTMLGAVLGRDDVEVRLRPAYYPFVEPGFDVDIRSTTAPPEVRYSRWMELLGCGMIHPQVLRAGGIDPTAWQGFAFGMGLERLAMIRHGIADIRVFNGADLRALRQIG
jgi:phenylalanyl-tRNA synthetase alpha chain